MSSSALAASQPTTEVLPALGLLPHQVTVLPLDAGALLDRPDGDVILLDARRDLVSARSFTRVLAAMDLSVPVIAVLTDGGLIALSADCSPVVKFVRAPESWASRLATASWVACANPPICAC